MNIYLYVYSILCLLPIKLKKSICGLHFDRWLIIDSLICIMITDLFGIISNILLVFSLIMLFLCSLYPLFPAFCWSVYFLFFSSTGFEAIHSNSIILLVTFKLSACILILSKVFQNNT